MRLQRSFGRQTLPLTTESGARFSYVLPAELQRLLHEIDRSGGGTLEVASSVSEEQREVYYVNGLIEEAITSSQLEGAATTHRVATEMLVSGRKPRDRSEKMILNNYRTMQRIRELASEPLTPQMLFDLHLHVTDSTLDDAEAAGRLRRPDEDIVVRDEYGTVFHRPPPADGLSDRLEGMCAFANEEDREAFTHPLIRAIVLHFWLAYDHPFVDGNGRTARALFYWASMRAGYDVLRFVSISQVILKSPAAYYRAFLHAETDNNDLTYFMLHHCGVLEQAFRELRARVNRKAKVLKRVEQQLQGMASLGHRQQAILIHALKHLTARYTIEGHRRSHNVVYQTARTDLLDLVKRGLFRQQLQGRKLVFQPVEDLEARLSEVS